MRDASIAGSRSRGCGRDRWRCYDGNAASDVFRRFAHRTSAHLGSPPAFFVACMIILAWGVTGPLFHYSDTWQLVINTGTTIVTFLMVFLIQNTQNRDARASSQARRADPSDEGGAKQVGRPRGLSDDELQTLKNEFHALSKDAVLKRITEIQSRLRHRKTKGDAPSDRGRTG